MKNRLSALALGMTLFAASGAARAGTVSAVGDVVVLTNADELIAPRSGNFDEGPTSGEMPADVYASLGLTWRSGPLSSILPGVTQAGSAVLPTYDAQSGSAYFPSPLNGGTHTGSYAFHAGVATFSVTVTQVGLTASRNGTQYLTAWDASGKMIGQVTWVPDNTSSFIGIDTLGVPIAMVAYGNDDLWNGATYDVVGYTIISDSWRWGGVCSADADCDDGNVCTTDTCNAGKCTRTNNNAPCDDGNACTQADQCAAGSCVPGTPVVCVASDACHDAGVCDPTTGACSNPTKPDGASCDDGNACTQTDTCEAGVCTGTNPVVCPAPAVCHLPGTCVPETGLCTDPIQPDGTACADSNLCNASPTCSAGACVGTPVVCAPLDDCHLAGVCDPGTGTCSHPLKPNGEPCSDGNACTQGDACIDGVCAPGTPVVCPAKSGCHDVGVCNPVDGTCSEPVKTDGVSCDDANACTRTDSCSAGTCQGGNPVVCVAKDACHDVGTCNTADGKCSDPVKPDGTTCPGGTCVSGVCVPGEADAGVAGDAGADAPADPGIGGGGCGCRMAPSPSRAGLAGLVFVAFAVLRRRARRPAPLDEFR